MDVQCRTAGTGVSIPNDVTCDLSGLACSVSSGNSACPDMEIRYRCARSRGIYPVTFSEMIKVGCIL